VAAPLGVCIAGGVLVAVAARQRERQGSGKDHQHFHGFLLEKGQRKLSK
jgi:hypothetical protein